MSTAPTTPVNATRGLVGQVFNVLMQNALRHGTGTVTITVEGMSITVEGMSITVDDQGDGVADEQVIGLFERPRDHHEPHGRGLALARRLAEADGGHLELACRRPARFRLSYVAAPD